jgi:hypothetical protein
MKIEPVPKDPIEAKLSNIIDMGLGFSGMIRLFKRGEKKKLHKELLSRVRDVFEAESEEEFRGIHSSFCEWGTREIILAERKRKEKIIRKSGPASYGQIAKTLNVVLKVTVYYCHLPNCEKSEQISRWLDAAVDTKMMDFLKERYPEDIRPWPTTIEQVDASAYKKIEEIVRKYIKEKHRGNITPVQFDDIYWKAIKSKEASFDETGQVPT